MEEIKVNGKQEFIGIEIPVVEGGFGEGCKCIVDKTVSDIHNITPSDVRKLINRNISRFKDGLDYIDLKIVGHEVTDNFGFSKMQLSKAQNIYLLSERGYAKVIKIMDTDLAWEIHDKLIDEYFSMRQTITQSLSKRDVAILALYHANTETERMVAAKQLEEAVALPLLEVIEEQKPMVGLAEMRIDKKGCFSITDATKTLNLKRGWITKWAKEQGYLHKTQQEVNTKGEEYFKVYSTDGIHNQIGITEAGLKFISENIESIKLAISA